MSIKTFLHSKYGTIYHFNALTFHGNNQLLWQALQFYIKNIIKQVMQIDFVIDKGLAEKFWWEHSRQDKSSASASGWTKNLMMREIELLNESI